jgi:hypothetical protein
MVVASALVRQALGVSRSVREGRARAEPASAVAVRRVEKSILTTVLNPCVRMFKVVFGRRLTDEVGGFPYVQARRSVLIYSWLLGKN